MAEFVRLKCEKLDEFDTRFGMYERLDDSQENSTPRYILGQWMLWRDDDCGNGAVWRVGAGGQGSLYCQCDATTPDAIRGSWFMGDEALPIDLPSPLTVEAPRLL
jgi:hypothetical protein